jgi:hypothetical protein
MQEKWGRVQGVVLTNQTKAAYVTGLSILLENQAIYFPAIPELIAELGQYGSKTLSGGATQYGAPEDKNDDCVTALMLAASMIRGVGGNIPIVKKRARRVQ